MSETVVVRRDDLELLRKVCACYVPHPPADDISEVMARTLTALSEPGDGEAEPAEDPRPEGVWARVELPGYRQHTGWITEETRFGVQSAVVRDWDGREVAIVAIGPGSQVVPLPTPMRRPETRAALPVGAGDVDDDDGDWDDNEDDPS